MPTPIRDFGRVNEILTSLTGAPARVLDKPGAAAGQLDSRDVLEITDAKSGKTRRVALGDKRFQEAALRTRIVEAGYALAKSGANFSQWSSSDKVNPQLWTLGYGGKIGVRKFLDNGKLGSPAKALRDIFEHGDKYAFECSTAMMVIFHKAILDTVGDAVFDKMFTEPNYLKIFRWELKDNDYLDLEVMDKKKSTLVPGSHYYYTNPDVTDKQAAFAGENVIYLGTRGGQRVFYAHGVVGGAGDYTLTEEELLRSLRALRRPGATRDPFRERFTYSLDAAKLSAKYREYGGQ